MKGMLNGVLAFGAALASVGAAFAQSAVSGAEPPEQAAVHTAGIAVLGVALPVIGWLLSRAIAKNDESIKELSEKIDRALAEFARLDKELALVKQSHEALRARVQEEAT